MIFTLDEYTSHTLVLDRYRVGLRQQPAALLLVAMIVKQQIAQIASVAAHQSEHRSVSKALLT